MSKSDRWSYGQAVNFLLANVPCDSPYNAARMLEQKTIAGDIRAFRLDGSEINIGDWSDSLVARDVPITDAMFDRRTVEHACAIVPRKNVGGRPQVDGGTP